MPSQADDLEQELRKNLKLRRELGVKAARATAATALEQHSRIAYRSGRFLYWGCLVLVVAWAAFVALFVWGRSDLTSHLLFYSLFFFVPMLLLYGIGRAFRYFLSGK
jgi:hypothetical protein